MENEKGEKKEEKEEKEEKKVSSSEKPDQKKKKIVAKELIELTHVETRKQEISQRTKQFAETLKQKESEKKPIEKLSNDEMTILQSFMEKRLFLNRIAIIINQSRIPLGKEPFKKAELEDLMNGLISKGLITSVMVNKEKVYILTEKGREFIL